MGSKISCLRKNEEEEIIADRNILEKIAEEKENREESKVSLLGLECILIYFDNRKRLDLSLYYPTFRILEKQCPLTLDYLSISQLEVTVDGKNMHTLTATDKNISASRYDVLKFVDTVFTGRTRFRVKHCTLEIEIPFGLNIDCERVYVHPKNSNHASYYSNVIRNVDCLVIYSLCSPHDLNYPWIRNVEIVRLNSSQLFNFLPALSNIPAETIIVDFYLVTQDFYDLVRTWCESRNGRVGSQLFMIFCFFNLRKDLESRWLCEMGFIEEANLRWRLPMNNNSEAVLSIRDDFGYFRTKYFKDFFDPDEYVCLEIVEL